MENSDETESAPPTINDLLELVYGVMDTLDKQKTSGEPLKFKEKALSQLDHIQERLYEFEAAQPATNARLDLIERKLEKIDSIESKLEAITEATTTSFKEIKEATTNSEKSWEQIAATNTTTASATTKAAIQAKRRDLQETLRKQREPYQVTLTTTDKESQKTITDMHPYQINKRCQDIINIETEEKPKLNGISKITNGIRLQCKSPEDANIVRMLNWNSAFEGLRMHKQKYGIVVHGVSADEMEALANGDTKAATLKEWEEANGIKLGTVKPLRQKPRANRIPPPHHSIVVLAEDPHEADKCIKLGFFTESQHHKAEKYVPQLHITQCYKCYEYGHRATHCKQKEKCGKCGAEDHKMDACQSTVHTCCRCKGSHQAWSLKCPHRVAESQRLAALRAETSPYFTSGFN